MQSSPLIFIATTTIRSGWLDGQSLFCSSLLQRRGACTSRAGVDCVMVRGAERRHGFATLQRGGCHFIPLPAQPLNGGRAAFTNRRHGRQGAAA